jgi:hypothetical protein
MITPDNDWQQSLDINTMAEKYGKSLRTKPISPVKVGLAGV